MTETEIQRDCMAYAKGRGWLVHRMNAGGVRVNGGYAHLSPVGTPDLLFVLDDGRVVWCEVKRPGQDPTSKQLAVHAALINMGHRVVVVHDVMELAREMEGV